MKTCKLATFPKPLLIFEWKEPMKASQKNINWNTFEEAHRNIRARYDSLYFYRQRNLVFWSKPYRDLIDQCLEHLRKRQRTMELIAQEVWG